MSDLKKIILSLLSLFIYSHVLCMRISTFDREQLRVNHQSIQPQHNHNLRPEINHKRQQISELDYEPCLACIEADVDKNSEPQSILEAARLGDFSRIPINHAAWQAANVDSTMAFDLEKETDCNKKHGYCVDAGKTLLHYAVQFNALDTVKILLEHGADPLKKNQNGTSPLALAVHLGYGEATKILLKASEKQLNQSLLDSLLFDAINTQGNLSVINTLVTYGAYPNARTTKDKLTPLHRAAHNNQPEVIQYLIGLGAYTNAQDIHGITPLMMTTVNMQCYAAAQELLRYDSVRNMINLKTENGCTALHGAAMNGHDKLVQLLLKHGANSALKNERGHNALQAAILCKHSAIADILKQHQATTPASHTQDTQALHMKTQKISAVTLAALAEQPQ